MKTKSKGDVSWFLTPQSKKPFAYSTKAESDAIKVLLEVQGDLREVLSKGFILSPTERSIIQTYVDNGIFNPIIK